MNKKWERIARLGTFAAVVVALASLIVAASVTNCFSLVTEPEDVHELVENVSMKIISPNWNIEYMHVNTNNATVADFLFECADQYNFDVEAEFWTGYNSFFVEAINGIENGEDGRYWQYYVNGEYADVGCSKYVLQDNDVVEWWFKLSQLG